MLDWEARVEGRMADIFALVYVIAPFQLRTSAELDAVDLLCEVDQIHRVCEFVDERSFERVCSYVTGMSSYTATMAERNKFLKVQIRL
jgi:26S proteasome regulatory subunit N1